MSHQSAPTSRGRGIFALLLALVVLLLPATATADEAFRFYPETGHYVDGDWLAWYDAHGEAAALGAPRTEDYREIDRLVQYFRTIRLEWDCGATGKGPCKLRPGTLGEQILGRKIDLPDDYQPVAQGGTSRVFQESGQAVSGDFLTLYDQLGGFDFFGVPLTGETVEAGQTVQWFQRARMQRDSDGVVRLSPLGDYWIDTLKRVPLITILRLPAPAAPAASPPAAIPGQIAFSTAAGQIVIVQGGQSRNVTSGNEPALSPDGTRIAFVRYGQNAGIWIVDLTTGEERRVSTDYGARSPVWSPDGSRLAYVKQKQDVVRKTDPATRRPGWMLEDHYQVATVDASSGTVTDIPSELYSSFPTWSPDGKQLIFDSNEGLVTIAADGSGAPQPVPNTSRVFTSPAWSPDGSLVAVAYRRVDHTDIALIRPDGSAFSLLTDSPYQSRQANNVAPAWSPDGSAVVFLSDRDGSWRIYTVTLADHTVRPLSDADLGVTYTFADDRSVSWSR